MTKFDRMLKRRARKQAEKEVDAQLAAAEGNKNKRKTVGGFY